MENASKALIMAGSIFIAIIIIGALLLMFNSLSKYQDTNVKNERDAQIVKFNNQYETYNRKEVRGSDLYSLLNKVVDYNRTKSDAATGNDEGQNFKFKAMTIIVYFPKDVQIKNNWTYDGTIRLFKTTDNILESGNVLKLNESTTNTFATNIEAKISTIESKYNGKTGITNLALGISNLFPNGTPTKEEEKQKYNDICTYYEYICFKRAYFDCTNITYNDTTGRIIQMTFKYNPNKIE